MKPAGAPNPKLRAGEEEALAGVDNDWLADELGPTCVLKLKGALEPELLLAPPNPAHRVLLSKEKQQTSKLAFVEVICQGVIAEL